MKPISFRIDGSEVALEWETSVPGTVRLKLPGETQIVEVAVTRLGDLPAAPSDARPGAAQAGGVWRISFEGNTSRVEGARAREGTHLSVDGASFLVSGAEGPRKGEGAAGAPARTAAPLPGIVRRILVAPGDAVARGQVVLLMEAMKMECPVAAGRGGTVRKILIEAGHTVDVGTELVVIE